MKVNIDTRRIKNKVIINTIWLMGERIVQMAIALIVGMLTARYLGPSNYGLINFSASIIAFFNALCTLGLNEIMVKEIIDNKSQQGAVLGSAIILRLISSFMSMITIISIVVLLDRDNNIFTMILFLQAIGMIFRAFEIIEFWYQSQLKSKYSSIIKTSAYIIMSIYKIVILVLGKSVEWFAFATSLDLIVIAILLVYFYYKHRGEKLKFSLYISKELLRKSHHFIISGVMVAVYAQMDKVMIGTMLDSESVGLYSVAIYICNLWTFILTAIINSVRPIIMEQKKVNEKEYIKRLKQLYAIIIWISIIVAIGITILSKPLIIILYGKDYLGAIPVLIITIWYCGYSFIGVARGIWLVCENKQKYEKRFAFLGATCNLTMNILFIPQYGIIGAAVATLITQIVTAIIAPLMYKETRVHSRYIVEAFLLKDIFS